jgi:pimeloyl-ACP methyl ester carboxylesterase
MRGNDATRSALVLVHGLWMTGLELIPLRRRLADCGFRPFHFAYPSVRFTVEENGAELGRFVSTLAAPEVHYLGHSLGGLVILQMLAMHLDPRPGRVVLLGTAYQSCHVAQRVGELWWGRPLLGASWEALCTVGPPCPAGREVGVIAGNLGLGIGRRLFPGPPGGHDGTVGVDETYIPGMKEHLVMGVSHMGLVLSAKVAKQVCRFLKTGTFKHP